MVMCKQPNMRAPLSGFLFPYSFLRAIKPGISVSAKEISFLPNSASEISFTLKSFDIIQGFLTI